MDSEQAKAKLSAMAKELGHEISVFTNSTIQTTSNEADDESDDFYNLTAEDYYRMKPLEEMFKGLKTRKLREAEEEVKKAAQRARVAKATIRVRFPDSYILEAKLRSSEKVQSLVDLVAKVVARPDMPFYLYTAPPKQVIKDMSQDFYEAGFAPGANVYFAYKDSEVSTGPYLRDDVRALNGLSSPLKSVDRACSEEEIRVSATPANVPVAKKPVGKKPKWLKL